MNKIFKELLFLVLGNLILAFAIGMFLLPNNVLSGGVSGISLLLAPFIPLENSLIIFILSILLLMIGWLCLGFKFMMNSILSSFLYPIFLMFIENIFNPPLVEPILASIFGGLLAGIGVGIVVRQGASTGGMDIPPLVINHYFHYDVSKSVMVIDAFTVLGGLFVYGFEEVLIGLISVYFTGLGISKALDSYGTKAKYLQIISDNYKEINDKIQNVLMRGSTIIDVKGGWKEDPRKLLLAVVTDKQYHEALDIINEIDKNAFVIVTDAKDVHGEGFDDIVRI